MLFACHAVAIEIVALARIVVAFAVVRLSTSWQIVLALESNRPMPMMMMTAGERPAIAVNCNRPANRAIGISLGRVDIDSYRPFDAYRVTLMLEWPCHSSSVA